MSHWVASISDFDSAEEILCSTEDVAKAALEMLLRRELEPQQLGGLFPGARDGYLREHAEVKALLDAGDVLGAAEAFNRAVILQIGKHARLYSTENAVYNSIEELERDFPEMLVGPDDFTFQRFSVRFQALPQEAREEIVRRVAGVSEQTLDALRAQARARVHGDRRELFYSIRLLQQVADDKQARAAWELLDQYEKNASD